MSYRRHLVLLKLLPAIILFETEFAISKADVPPPRNPAQHWSFQPLSNPSLPQSRNSEWPTSPLDHFILAKLEQHQLTATVTAGKHTLIRRATFDLTGLPPTPDEIHAFLNDAADNAFARVIDRLLSSPRYGEHWGRHWLDIARYADSNGLDENMAYPHAFHYRDYVIRSFNEDKPYDQFILEQLAGDLLPVKDNSFDSLQPIIATGFLALGPKSLREVDGTKMEMDIIDEQLATTSKVFMALTMECARCHDHKFDPLTMTDYYGLAGIFKSTRSMSQFIDNRGIGNGKWLEQELIKDPPLRAMVVTDGTISNLPIHQAGSHLSLGPVIARRFPKILTSPETALLPAKQSGRLELARWMASPIHPLTARVMVNRIWLWHFGTGLVSSPDNFGLLGSQPTHPHLLDYLAREFITHGWSIKQLHRLIMLSSTYQLSTHRSSLAQTKDPDNQFYSHFNRRRLQAEEIRDAILSVSATLDPGMGGSLLNLKKGQYVNDAKTFQHLVRYESHRRSVYLPVIRNILYDLFDVFDFPDPSVVNGKRATTTVATQSLFLMNSPLVLEAAEQLATRLNRLGDAPVEKRIELAYEICFGRPSNQNETHLAKMFLRVPEAIVSLDASSNQSMWNHFCQVLLISNEFVFLE